MAYKTIGVLGGLGPQATMDFVDRVHRVSQHILPARANSGYPPMVVYYCRFPPILLNDEGKPLQPIQPEPRLLDAARKLGAIADFIVVPSNTPHLLQKDIEGASGLKMLSMTELTLDEVKRRHWKHVGILGLHDPVMYTKSLEELNIAYRTVSQKLSAQLDASIFKVMEGGLDSHCTETAMAAIAELRDFGVEGILLGCTEIPLMIPEAILENRDLLNPVQLLAEAAVKLATGS